VKDIDRIRPGQVVDIPLKKLVQGNLPGQSSGVVTIPFVMISNPKEMIEKHTRSYTVQRGDTVSTLIARRFGGRYGNKTYSQGLKLFKAANPHIKDVNRIYAGQKIYMPDPSIREQSWYRPFSMKPATWLKRWRIVLKPKPMHPRPQPAAAAAPEMPGPPPEATTTGPAAEAASVIGGRLLDKGTYFLPMKQGKDFELDLSRYPIIDLQNGSKVILSDPGPGDECRSAADSSYWENVKVVKSARKRLVARTFWKLSFRLFPVKHHQPAGI
jgi:hypothetical protein